MRKHENQQQPFFMDIFEPPPQWRTTVAHSNNGGGHAGYHAHSPTHRSPIHHQPSLSEIVCQDFNSHSNVQDAYPSVYQERRSQLQQQQRKSKQQYYDRVDSALETSEINDYESAASSLHTLSTSPHANNRIEYIDQYEQDEDLDHYDDVEDNDSVDKRITIHRYQPDNISIATSLFTAVDHMEQLQPQEDEYDEDDSSSTENTRHGYLPTQPPYEVIDLTKQVNTMIKKLDIQSTVQWEDYRPQYRLLNESYDNVKKEIYQEIYSTMQRIQELDTKYNATKLKFRLDMERNYDKMSNNLISQCNDLVQEKQEYHKKIQNDETTSNMRQSQNEKVRLNVGGSIFETSLSTLRRDTNSLLAIMFSGRHLITSESDGSYFVDRDPSHFRLVLNYLRDLRIPPTILKDNKIRQELLQEAKYYCIVGLVNLLEQ